MRYYFLVYSVFFLTIGLAHVVRAQNLANSIYSYRGVGELIDRGTSEQEQQGNIHAAYFSPYSPNYHNPASLSYLTLTNYNIGVTGQFEEQKQNGAYLKQYNAFAGNASLAFPLMRYGGACLGFRPYSNAGLETRAAGLNVQGQTADYRYIGTGGISRFFGGIAFTPLTFLKDSNWHTFSIGYYASFLFGQVRRTESLLFSGTDTSGFYNSASIENNDYRGALHQIGWQQSFRLTTSVFVCAGATYQFGQNIQKNTQGYYITNNSVTQQLIIADTLTGVTSAPVSWSAGLGLGITQRWRFWTDYARRETGSEPYATASQRFAAGMMFWPGPDGRGSIWQRSQYRLGASRTQNEMQINGTPVSSLTLSGGIGLGFRKLRPPMLNLGFEYRRRNGQGLVSQDIFMLHLGISINEKWFIRRRID